MRTISLLVFLALAGSAAAAALGGGESPGVRARVVAADGSFSFANSRPGMPIFSAAEIAPGNSVSGTVEIADTGTEPGQLTLAQDEVTDSPGVGGGQLSSQLALQITDITSPANPVTVYAGPLAPMPAQPAGRIRPGESRAYEFVATLPASGPAQNEVQGASASVAYSWTASDAPPDSGPKPAPSLPPAQPPAGAPPAPTYSAPASQPLTLAIIRVRRVLRYNHLVVWARCDTACSISARGRFRVHGPAGHRSTKLRFSRPPHYRSGTQRLRIPIPHRLRRWLEASPGRLRLRTRVVLVARSPDGDQATTRRALRVRSVARPAFARGSGLERSPRARSLSTNSPIAARPT